MSYDLAVFDPQNIPNERALFLEWFMEETSWSRDVDYNDPSRLTPNLSKLFHSMATSYRPLNGETMSRAKRKADYSLGEHLIYIGFSLSDADHAYKTLFKRAGESECGFFDVSSWRSTIWLPDGVGGLRKHSNRPWWKFV